MTITTTEPSYFGIRNVIVRPRFEERVKGIENCAEIVLESWRGERLTIAVLHSDFRIQTLHTNLLIHERENLHYSWGSEHPL